MALTSPRGGGVRVESFTLDRLFWARMDIVETMSLQYYRMAYTCSEKECAVHIALNGDVCMLFA